MASQAVELEIQNDREPYLDGLIDFDPRITFGKKKPQIGPPIKQQQEWAQAVYQLLTNKKSNLQFQIGVEFCHQKYGELSNKDADKYFMAVLRALNPFVRTLIG